MRQQRHNKATSETTSKLRDLVSAIVEQGDARSVMEMYYWSQEPGLLEIMRAIATMPENARTALEVFLAMSHEPSAISAQWDGSGRLTLTSPQAGQAIAVIQYCTEHDDVEKPLLPN
jgi:hypothetical protein